MRGVFAYLLIALASLAVSGRAAYAQDRIPEYARAEKFTQEKSNAMPVSASEGGSEKNADILKR